MTCPTPLTKVRLCAAHRSRLLQPLTIKNFTVNVIKYEPTSENTQEGEDWKSEATFDATKDKAQFRQYEDACDRVKSFYREQHGTRPYLSLFLSLC